MKKIYLYALLILVVSCQKIIKIETAPSNARILYNGKVYKSPIELEYIENEELKIRKEYYNEIVYSKDETKSLTSNRKVIKLIPKLYNLNITGKDDLMEININGNKINNNIELPFGDYHIEIKKDGYFAYHKDISVPEVDEINPEFKKKYILNKIPNGVSNIKINRDSIYLNSEFSINPEPSIYIPTYISNLISFKYNDIEIETALKNEYLNSGFLNIKLIIDNVTIKDLPNIIVESDWMDIYDTELTLKRLFFPATGFESMPDDLIDGENKLIKNPSNLFPHISIANPTSDLIGSYIIAKSGNKEKKYEISEEFYKSNIDEIYAGEEYNADGIYTKQKFLKIDNLNIDAPFNNSVVVCELYINNKLHDSSKLNVNKDIYYKFGDSSYGIYSDLRDSIFDYDDTSSTIHYLYSDNSRSNEYVVIYMSKDREYIPLYIYRIGNISKKPAKIIIDEKDSNNYFILITKDLTKISNIHVMDLKYFTNK